MFYRSEGQQMEARCRTGLPAPLVHLDVLSPEGTPLPHDGRQVGEVVVRSPWLTQAYFKEPERSEALWTDGWLHTGDLGSIDQEGYLQISDRIKDVIKTGGEWVSSLELEDCISGHQAVREAAVIAIPDSKWDERPLALVVLKTEFHGRIQAEDIRTFLQQHAAAGKLPRFAIPERIEIVEAIAKTSVGKIDKKKLRRRFCAV
jgi:fatty-acyl-CoA synthase